MPFAPQNTVAITLPADGCVLNFFGLGDPGPTHWRLSSILWLIIMYRSLIYSHQMQKKIIFWPKTLQQGTAYWCILMLWLPFAHRWGIWGPIGLLACAYLNDHVRLLKRYHVKCLMPALFLPPEFAYRIPNFLTHFFVSGIQWASRPGFIFYRVWIPLPRI